MIVNMIFFFEWEKGETDDFETHVAFAWLQKRNENVCIVRESNPGRPRGRRAFYHWTNDACTLWRHHIQNWLQDVSKRNYTAAWAVVAEWLRRLTRNEFPFGSVGSNPTNCENFRCFYQIAIPREISGSHLKQNQDTVFPEPVHKAVVAEWLRRLTRNEFPSGSVGSNPTDCVFIASYFTHFDKQISKNI